MERKERSPEKQARQAKIRELLQLSSVNSMEDIETISEFMEEGLDAELSEELSYSKYDYRNKETDNSRNGHSSKTLRTSFGKIGIVRGERQNSQFCQVCILQGFDGAHG